MTTTASTSRVFRHPIGEVFGAVTDHEALSKVPVVRSARLVREGDAKRNGRGAVRLVATPAYVRFREEIVGFDRPREMRYAIRESRPPVDHNVGWILFTEVPEGTLVEWTSKFRLRVPVVGPVVEPLVGVLTGRAFSLVLKNIDDRLASQRRLGRS